MCVFVYVYIYYIENAKRFNLRGQMIFSIGTPWLRLQQKNAILPIASTKIIKKGNVVQNSPAQLQYET